jgi:predicted  nucleic acid-binding Zn-ribbon protein
MRAAQAALGEIKETNARGTVKNKAKAAAANRRDFKALEDKKDKLIIDRRKAQISIEDIEKEQKLIVYEEEKKEAEKWIARMEKKPGWFS